MFTPQLFRSLARSPVSWTCRKCLLQMRLRKFIAPRQGFRSTQNTPRASRSGGKILFAASGGTAAIGAGILSIGDDAKHFYTAAERTGRVMTTLAICINEYETSRHSSNELLTILMQLSHHARQEGEGRRSKRFTVEGLPSTMRGPNTTSSGEERFHLHKTRTAFEQLDISPS